MTCIVAIEHEGRVWIGADSSVNGGWDKRILKPKKIFTVYNMLIGVAGDMRTSQIIQAHLKDYIPKEPDSTDDKIDHMVSIVAAAVRECLTAYGRLDGDGKDDAGNFAALVGYQGQLFNIGPDFSVAQYTDGFDAIGIGRPYALGAVRALIDSPRRMHPKDVISQALKVAEQYSNGVSAPFYIRSI